MKNITHNTIKLLIILIPIIFLQYLFYQNFISAHDFEYNYDIGSENDDYLSPVDRISQKYTSNNLDYRNLTDALVYFNVPFEKNSPEINISIKFYDNFPQNSQFQLGAKDQEEWHYKYNLIYSKTIEDLMQNYPYEKKNDLMLFKLNEDSPQYTIDDFQTNPPAVKLATDQEITIPNFKIENYNPSNLEIETSLRGTQTFYVYIKGDFEIEVEKIDLNWYENEDELEINLYHLNKTLIASSIIEDDGEDDKKTDKNNDDEDSGELIVQNLKEGVYKLELKNNGDMAITNIKLNQNKLILYKTYFPIQNEAYFNNSQKRTKIYFKLDKPTTLTAQTHHTSAIDQTIDINEYELKIKKVSKIYAINLPESEDFYELTSKKNDIQIKGPEFFAFSKESWFNPFQGKNVDFKSNKEYLESNVDYVLVEYKPTLDLGNGWRLAKTSFNKNEIFIKDDSLSLLLNTPHLSKNETKQFQIAIDSIKSNVHQEAPISLK